MRKFIVALAVAASTVPFGASIALAQSAYNGAPPPDEKALVTASTAPGTVPTNDKPATDGTTATLSAGGQLATGNSSLLAGTVNGSVDMRRGLNEYGAFVLGSYGQSTPPGGRGPWRLSAISKASSATIVTSPLRLRSFSSPRAETTGSRASSSA